jgi:TM2 domain-containing membrane protein YozV
VSERRCPNCGGLVGADAEWCTQCFTRLDIAQSEPPAEAGEGGVARPGVTQPSSTPQSESEGGTGPAGLSRDVGSLSEAGARPASPTRSGPAADLGERVIHSRGDTIVWTCPACGTENPIDSPICSACGTPFRQMLREPEEPIDIDPGRAAMLSLIFPGIGHFLVGRRGDGLARGVVFAFALVTGIVSLGAVTRGSGGLYTLLMVMSLGVAAALYIVSTVDAGRAATRLPPLLPPRLLMYGGLGLMLTTLGVLVIGAMGARG